MTARGDAVLLEAGAWVGLSQPKSLLMKLAGVTVQMVAGPCIVASREGEKIENIPASLRVVVHFYCLSHSTGFALL